MQALQHACIFVITWFRQSSLILHSKTHICPSRFRFPQLQMRLKDPFSLKAADMTKRTNKPRKPRDEESSDEVSGKSLKQHRTVEVECAFEC